MPRHESPRSPLGSTTSKRSHRDVEYHDRSRKDDSRSYRRRSRTRSPENRYRDRDYRHHRDRSRDRYREHDSYRSSRRERSPRERRRSRDRDGLSDYRKRSRDRDVDTHRNDSREKARRRREDDSRERPHKPNANDSRSEPTPTPEQKQAERQKKLEEWKRKQAAERERKQQEAQAAGGARGLLAEIDRKSQLTPTVASPVSPIPPTEQSDATSPAPYAGPFDPKAIAKKVAATSANSTKLGALPEISKMSAPSDPKQARLKVDITSATNGATAMAPVAPRAFGLSSKANAESEKAKPGLDFGDDEGGRKKLEKLEDIEDIEDNEDIVIGNADESDGENDDDVDDNDDEMLQDTEEVKEARRQRLEDKREERLQAQEESNSGAPAAKDSNGDVAMVESTHKTEVDNAEDSDPLDAFMAGIEDVPSKKSSKTFRQAKGEALFSDDEVELEAVEDDLSTTTIKRSKKKDIPASVSGRSSSSPFRKNFYKVPSELESLSEADVTDIRHELGIKVKGNPPIPTPVQSFSSLGLNPATYGCIQVLGYEKPTGIQSQAIPAIMSGRDVLGIASTGSGKTLAFLLPLFRHILDQRPLAGQDGPIALIMTPTRELASQISKEGRTFFKAQNLTAVTAVGGNPIKDDIAALKRGCHLVVGTPGRLLELLTTARLRLQRITYMVLDEADRMFDMGFEPQVTRIESFIRRDSQKVFTSATLNRQMAALAGKLLHLPLEITVGGKSVVNSDVDQRVEVLQSTEAKFTRLLELLGNLYERDENADIRVLIFVERQETCDTLMLSLLRKGYPCSTLHGGKDQVDRDSTIGDFKAGVIPVLIATSVAARGLDVKELKLVISYDAPSHLEDYVHRCGRTGRAGQKGSAYTFLTPEQDRFSIGIAKALRESGVEVPDPVKKLVEIFDEKVKSGKEKISGSGFGGKGLERLDQERDAARARERKTHKTGDELDEDETEEKGKEDKGDDLITKAASSVQAASAPAPLAGVPKGIDLDGKIIVHKTEASAAGANNALDKVSQAITSINERLSKNKELRQGVPIDNKGPDAGAFHATLEINDFPQKARWAVTNRTNVAKILEATGTSITTKGSFYAQGKEPASGENPKLYILVEGDTEIVVTNAMRELMRLLKEGTIAAADSDARAPTSGRYNVV